MHSDNYIRFEPNTVQIDHLAVNVSEDTVDSLNLTSTQYMIVGEQVSSSGSNINKSYSFIVDNEGVSIKSSIPNRQAQNREYALYVEGDVFVNGQIQSVHGTVGVGSTSTVGGSSDFVRVPNATDTLFHNGKLVLGSTIADATNNQNAFKVIESADRNIDHAQIAIQNTQNSIFHLGIVGTAKNSPAVINTTSRTPLEFHANRQNDYFARTYCNAEIPSYSTINDAPHMCIDINGNVGIRTNCNVHLNYTFIDKSATLRSVNKAANLHVNGMLFTSNLLIYDTQSETINNIDNLYVRRRGIWVEASNVNTGTFPGIYAFTSNISVNTPLLHDDYNLYVNGNAKFEEDLVVEGESKLKDLQANKIVSYFDASFSNNVLVERDITVNETLRVKGQIQSLFHIDGSNVWCNIDFRPQNIDYVALKLRAAGDVLSTAYKFGVGINQTSDQVENSFVVKKRIDNMYQFELSDQSTRLIERFAAMGHFKTDSYRAEIDGSLIITTGNQFDARFNNTGLFNMRQNIYFYPGEYVDSEKTVLPMIRQGNPPTLGVFTKEAAVGNKGRVGINTFTPRSSLDVNGDISVTGQYLFTDTNGDLQPIGKWLARINANASSSTNALYTSGLYYLEEDAPHVGINVPPEFPFGLSVAGGIKSYGGYFTNNNEQIVPWLRPTAAYVLPSQQEVMYSPSIVGIGVTNIQYPLEIASQYNVPAFIAIHNGGTNNTSGIIFADDNNSWSLQANKNDNSIQLSRHAIPTSNLALWTRLDANHNHQVFIAADSNLLYSENYDDNASLTVGGNLHVIGTINATNGYRFNGQVMINNNIEGDYPEISTDDVFIGGNTIHVRPNNLSYMSVGYTDAFMRSVFNSTTAVLRVYQSVTTRTAIARFIAKGSSGFIEIMNENNKGLRIGVIENTVRMLDVASGNAFMTFASDPNNLLNRFVGINTTAPAANLHVITSRGGNNMLKLTRINTVDTPDTVASINIEKRIQISDSDRNAQFYRWSFLGPNPSFQQKLTLNYAEADTVAATKETFCFTNKGSIGVLTTTPEYALDIACKGKHGSIRMFSACNLWDTPQLIFQSGASIFGQDVQNDYRLFSASNNLTLEQASSSLQVPYKLLNFTPEGNVGIRNNGQLDYECTIGGKLNVTNGIFLNGRQLFSVDASTGLIGLYLRENDVVLQPRVKENNILEWGGVAINYSSGKQTSNLFYIAGGNNANMMVMDSGYPNVQVHFVSTKTGSSTGSIYRLESENDTFRLSLKQDVDNTEKFVSDSSNEYPPAFEIDPFASDQSRYNMRLFGDLTMVYPDASVHFNKNATVRATNSNVQLDINTSNNGLIILQTNPSAFEADSALLMLSNVDFANQKCLVTRDNRVRLGNVSIPSRLSSYRLAISDGILSYGHILPGDTTFTLGNSIDRWGNIFIAAAAQINIGNVKLIQVNNEAQFKNIGTNSENFVSMRVKEFIMDDNQTTFDDENNFTNSTDFFYKLTPDSEYKLLVKETNRFTSVSVNYAPLWRNLDGNFYNFEGNLSTGNTTTVPDSKFYVYNSLSIPTMHIESSRKSILYIDETDKIGIGTTAPTVAYENNVEFKYNQTGSFEENVFFKKSVDIELDCVVHGDITNDSDIRIKKDLEKITSALDKVTQLTGYTFTRTRDNVRSTGLVAQDILQVLPEVVHADAEGMYSVAYGNMMGLIVEAIKDLKAEVDSIKAIVASR